MFRKLAVVIALLVPAMSALALDIDIIPSAPTESTPVDIRPWKEMTSTGYENMQTLWSREGNTFHVDWYMRDLRFSGIIILPVIVTYSGLAEVGVLPAGSYEVNATLWMATHERYAPYNPIETAQTSFVVVPEPAGLLLLACGLILIRRTRR